MTKRNWGWKPQLPDYRDYQFKLTAPIAAVPLPPKVDMRLLCPPVYDQAELGSCTANAIGAAFEFDQIKQKAKSIFTPSNTADLL